MPPRNQPQILKAHKNEGEAITEADDNPLPKMGQGHVTPQPTTLKDILIGMTTGLESSTRVLLLVLLAVGFAVHIFWRDYYKDYLIAKTDHMTQSTKALSEVAVRSEVSNEISRENGKKMESMKTAIDELAKLQKETNAAQRETNDTLHKILVGQGISQPRVIQPKGGTPVPATRVKSR